MMIVLKVENHLELKLFWLLQTSWVLKFKKEVLFIIISQIYLVFFTKLDTIDKESIEKYSSKLIEVYSDDLNSDLANELTQLISLLKKNSEMKLKLS